MKAKTDNPLYDKKLQKALDKLISEEMIASMFYTACVHAVKKDERHLIEEMFTEIAVDELNDHAKHLISWAGANDYSVPYKFKDFQDHAAASVVRQYNKLKDDGDASYYVKEALKSEDDAIKSYKEALEYDGVPQDLNSILLQNYYDEEEHHEELCTLKDALDGQVELVNW